MVIHTHNGGRQVHHGQLLMDHFLNGHRIILFRLRIHLRIAVIDAIHCLCKQNHIRLHLDCPKRHAGIRGKIWMPRTAGKENHAALRESFIGLIFGKQFRHGAAGKWSENPGFHALTAENLRHIDRVHHRSQHPDLIRLRPIYGLAGTSPPEIPAADHNADLDAFFHGNRHLLRHFTAHFLVKPGFLFSRQRFSAQLQKDSFRFFHRFLFPAPTRHNLSHSPLFYYYNTKRIIVNAEKANKIRPKILEPMGYTRSVTPLKK